ncbi:MAG: hypothetical protein ACKO72_05225 [Actinomycetes bacterium]
MSASASPGVGPIVTAVLAHPSLWPTAIGQAWRLAPAGWWRRPPFLPRPDEGYLAFRLETQYGRDAAPAAADVVSYLRWCRDEARRRGHHVDG